MFRPALYLLYTVLLIFFAAGYGAAASVDAPAEETKQTGEEARVQPKEPKETAGSVPYSTDFLAPEETERPAPQGAGAASGSGTFHAGAPPEFFFDIFYGLVSVRNARASASLSRPAVCFLSCTPASATEVSKDVSLDSSDMGGFRWGLWGGGELRHFGVGVELSALSHDSSEVSVNYYPVSLMPMARMAFLRTDAHPNGRLGFYAGPVLSFISIGRLRVALPGQPVPVSGSAEGSGYGYFIGGSWSFSGVALFAEIRSMHMKLDHSDDSDSGIGPFSTEAARASCDISFDMQQTVFGVSFKLPQ